jgi:hypothetical protein
MQRWNSTLGAMEYYNGSSWSQQFILQYQVDYLIVAGGGAGGFDAGGGGGGGGFLTGSSLLGSTNAYTITVGAGGS